MTPERTRVDSKKYKKVIYGLNLSLTVAVKYSLLRRLVKSYNF